MSSQQRAAGSDSSKNNSEMDAIESDADQLGSQFLFPLAIIGAVVVIGVFSYYLYQRLSRQTVRVHDISSHAREAKERQLFH